MLQVLVVASFEQSAPIVNGLRQSRPDWRVTPVSSPLSLQKQIAGEQYDVVVLDLAHAQGKEWIKQWAQEGWPTAVSTPLIWLTSPQQTFDSPPFLQKQNCLVQDESDEYLLTLPKLIAQAAMQGPAARLKSDVLADVVGLTTDAVIITQEDFTIIYCNPAATDVFGYKPAEMLGQPLGMLLPARYRLAHHGLMEQFAQTKSHKVSRLKRERLVARNRDGRELTVEISIMSLLRHGRTYFAAVVHDVSEQQETAASIIQYTRRLEALRQMEQAVLAARSPKEVAQTALTHLQQLIPFQQASIVALEAPAQTILLANVSQPELAFDHLDHTQILQDAAFAQILQQDGIRVVNDLQSAEFSMPFELSLIRQGFLAYMMVALTVQGELVGLMNLGAMQTHAFVSDHIDIVRDAARPVAVAIQQARLLEKERTQRHLAETLQEVARILSSTLDQERVLHVILDQLGRVISFDSAAVLLLQGEELLLVAERNLGRERPCSQLQYRSLLHIREVLSSGNPILIADTAADGRWQACSEADETCSWLGIPLTVKGIVIGLFSISKEKPPYYTLQDAEFALAFARQAAIAVENAQLYTRATLEIDERRQAEAALQIERTHLAEHVRERTAELSAANAQLARAVRARDEFLASMSHELRTPLNAILGMTDVLQTGAYGNLTEKQKAMLHTIIRSGYHLLELINDVLDVAKIEAGQLTLQFSPLPVPAVCNTCIDLIRAPAQKKEINIEYEIGEGANMVWGDELRLQQILLNLLHNAIKFTPAGGKVGLDVTCDPLLNTVHFSVWDTGIGMSLDDLRQLFSGPNGPKPFVQLDTGLSRQYEGTGLGLSLVYHLTELHGGSLTIKSEVGQGSRLTVSFPCQSILKDYEAQKKPEVMQTKKVKIILLAEDNELYARAISASLLSQGHQLIVAHTGLQAVQQARKTHPDLILLDLQMPEVGGAETLKLFHENTELRDIPVVMVTALVMPGDQEYYLRQGVKAFLQKPLYLPNLTATIDELLAD